MDNNTSPPTEEYGLANTSPPDDISVRRDLADDVYNGYEKLRQLVVMFERERTLSGHEIHDGIIQYLVGAIMMQEKALQLMGEQAFDLAHEKLTQSVAVLRTAMDEARRIITNRRPGALEELGLVGAIRRLVAESQERYGVECTFLEAACFTGLPAPLETAVFRIAQEALSNALRHSNSRAVLVSIAQRGRRLCLKVEDWGIGFDPGSIGAKRVGLEGIRYRAQLYGGQVKIRSSPGKGTSIKVQLPVQETE